MKELAWHALAWFVSIPAVSRWIIKYAQRTPYFHLPGYMNRWWLLNPYKNDQSLPEDQRHTRKYSWLPSIRVHHILREDHARDMHDHPWDARTVILAGWYDEERMVGWKEVINPTTGGLGGYLQTVEMFTREAGDTASLKFGEYHNITEVSPGGVYTLFFTWDYMGTWGFWVDGEKVPHKEYKDEGAA